MQDWAINATQKKLSYALFLILVLAVFTGCAHHSRPQQIPPIELETVGLYDEIMSVHLINAQLDNEDTLYGSIGAHRYYANYNEWTNFFIEEWSKELQKRGVTIEDTSPNKINVILEGFALLQGMFVIRTNMIVELSSPDKSWEKTFKQTDKSGWSGGRAFGSMLHHTIQELLQDPEVVGRMKLR